MLRVLRAGWLAPVLLLLGAGGQPANPPRPPGSGPPVSNEDGLANLCVYPSYIVIGRWTRATAEVHPKYGTFTRSELLIERVLADRTGELRPRSSVELLTWGGETEDVVEVSSAGPYAKVGQWWLVAVATWRDGPEMVAVQVLPDRWVSHLPDELALRATTEGLCNAHPDGIYRTDLSSPSIREEAMSTLRAQGGGAKLQR